MYFHCRLLDCNLSHREGNAAMHKKLLPITCPLCGRKNEFPVEVLLEGYRLSCPFCKLVLTLHGHMWEDIQSELAKLKEAN